MILNYRAIQIGVLTTILIAAGSTFGQKAAPAPCLNRIGQKEWAVLLKDLDPGKKKLLQDDDFRKSQVENLEQLLAFGCEAKKRGLDSEELNASELQFIRSETIAGSYDEKRLKLKPGPPFHWVTTAQVDAFYKIKANLTAFVRFFETKTELLRRSGTVRADQDPSAADVNAAKEFYAKMKIAERSASLMTPAERSTAEFRVRIQQTQFLARLVSEDLADEVSVSDAEIAEYIARHPEFDDKDAKARATQLRDRAKAGEDFAALANEFSNDPGNDGANGKKNGGLYADVPKGMMVPPFEKAALALQPGQISDLVQSDFGFHVIKLERKSADGSKYDVRHILIATGYKDPADPNGQTVPATIYVRTKLEGERETKVIDRIVAENPVTVEDIKLAAAPPATTRTRVTTRPASRKR
jgi:hypothetical protein